MLSKIHSYRLLFRRFCALGYIYHTFDKIYWNIFLRNYVINIPAFYLVQAKSVEEDGTTKDNVEEIGAVSQCLLSYQCHCVQLKN